MILLDTHVWVWWVSEPDRLSSPARDAVDGAAAAGAVQVSCISAWEVAMLAARGRLELALPVAEWVARSERLPFLRFVPVDNRIALESVALRRLHDDPADRIIVATARVMGLPLATRDRRLLKSGHVEAIW
jgi:PIN domain nuclease of toxin-antitoxin system